MREGCTPWPEELARRYREKGYWAPLTLGDMIEDAAKHFGPRVAIISDEGDRITYTEMVRKINRLALHLLDLGLRSGEVLVLQLPNVPEFIYLYFAMQKIGAVPLLCLPAHRFTEVSQLADLTDAVGYGVPGEESPFNFLELANQVRDRVPKVRFLFNSGRETAKGFINLLRLLEDPIEERVSTRELERLRPDPEEVAVFLLSGGTTGLPKVIPRTHTDYLYNSRQSSRMARLDGDTIFLVALPIAHNFPLACPGIQGCFLNGARVVLCRSPQTKHMFELIDREKVNHISLVPALINRCLDAPERKDYSLNSLRGITSGGQKVQPELKVRVERELGCMVQEVFGMAEGLLCYVRQDDPEEVRHQTAGRPICPDDEIRLVDEEGREVPEGEVGELLCQGPYTIRGYFRAQEYNRTAFTTDGFFHTGDLMRCHPSGNLVVEGRRKDLINRGGEKISAEEIENLILTHPSVHNIACTAMPDPMLGEKMCAFVVLREGRTLSLPELVGFLETKQIARFKLPERLEILPELPVSGFGKISKKDLRAFIAAKLQEEKTRSQETQG